MKAVLRIILLVLTNAGFAQIVFTVDGFSEDYYGKIEISDGSAVSGKVSIQILERKTNKEIIKLVLTN